MNATATSSYDPDTPIKLFHCTWTARIGGGITRMDALYYRHLDRAIVDPVFVAMNDEDPEVVLYDQSIPYRYTGVHGKFEKLVCMFAEADIVQFAGGFDPMLCEAARAAGVPVLIELMHLTEQGRVFPNIDLSICVSDTVKRVQPEKEKTVVIHNGMDVELFPFKKERDNNGRIIILESSRREKAKHFHLDELAGDILAINPSVEIWMAGKGHEGGSTDRVKFLGLQADIASLYRQSDFMALFSIEEPFGLVALEAMASGSVPIVSDDGGMAEIVSDGADGWLAPVGKGKHAVIETIRKAIALHGTERMEKMRRSARETVERKFSAEKCVRQYEDVYLDLARKKGVRGKSGESLNLAPTQEALTGDALSYFNMKDWAMVAKTALAMERIKEPVRNAHCIRTLEQLAHQSVAHKQIATADILYNLLYRSGYKQAQFLKNWLSLIPDSAHAGEVCDELIGLAPFDTEVVMMTAERYLNEGKITDALKILDEAARRIPDAIELAQTRDMLKSKINR